MKLAIIGNSHIACLKSAWDRMEEMRDPEIVFFGARGRNLFDMRIEDGRLAAGTPNLLRSIRHTSGRDSIDPKEFDAFLIFGCYAEPIYLDDLRDYSRALRNQYLRDMSEGRLYHQILGLISSVSDCPVFVGHVPLPAADLDRLADQSTERLRHALDTLEGEILAPLGARLVRQPPDTIVNGANTAMQYATGSYRLDIGSEGALNHREGEIKHMNADFGEKWLRRFLAHDLQADIDDGSRTRHSPETAGAGAG